VNDAIAWEEGRKDFIASSFSFRLFYVRNPLGLQRSVEKQRQMIDFTRSIGIQPPRALHSCGMRLLFILSSLPQFSSKNDAPPWGEEGMLCHKMSRQIPDTLSNKRRHPYFFSNDGLSPSTNCFTTASARLLEL